MLTDTQKLALLAVLIASNCSEKTTSTMEAYNIYKSLCQKLGVRPVTTRGFKFALGDLKDKLLIDVKVVSRGRYGRTSIISLTLPHEAYRLLYEDFLTGDYVEGLCSNPGPRMKPIVVSLDPETLAILDNLARSLSTTRSRIVREAIRYYASKFKVA